MQLPGLCPEAVEQIFDLLRKQRLGEDRKYLFGLATTIVALGIIRLERPRGEVSSLLRTYKGLENENIREDALEELLQKNLAHVVSCQLRPGNNIEFYMPSADIIQLADRLVNADGKVAQKLSELRNEFLSMREVSFRPVGNHEVFEDYLERLRGAHQEICIPMISRRFSEEAKKVLIERAQNNVTIKILMSNPRVAAEARAPVRETDPDFQRLISKTENDNRDTIATFQHLATVEMRYLMSLDNIVGATSMIVDKQIIRMTVHDAHTRRGTEGAMLVVKAPADDNIIRFFKGAFDECWHNAAGLGWRGKLRWRFRIWRRPAALIAVAVFLGILYHSATRDSPTGPAKLWFDRVMFGAMGYLLIESIKLLATDPLRERKQQR